MSNKLDTFKKALINIDRIGSQNIFNAYVDKIGSIDAIESLIVPALFDIGNDWETGTLSLSQIYMSGRICEDLIDSISFDKLDKLDKKDKHKNSSKMAIAVLEDYHLMGKRIIYSVLKSCGYKLLDYGQMNVNELVKRVIDDDIDILLISVLMLPSAYMVKDVREGLVKANKDVYIVVGGAPFRFDEKLWKVVGADAMGRSSADALKIVRSKIQGGAK